MLGFLKKNARFLFGSFHRMSKLFAEVAHQPKSTIKRIMIAQYYRGLSPTQSTAFKGILDFVYYGPTTNISKSTIENHFQQNQKKNKKNSFEENSLTPKKIISLEDIAYLSSFENEASNYSIEDVFKMIQTYQAIEGDGSKAAKINIITKTLALLSPIESEYFLKILTKKLAVKLQKKSIVQIFKIAQDRENLSLGLSSQNEVQFSFAQPQTKGLEWEDVFEPMLAKAMNSPQDLKSFLLARSSPFFVDVKYDGERTIITYQRGKPLSMMSRNGKDQGDYYTEIVEALTKELDALTHLSSIKLDGELVCVDQNRKPLPMQALRSKRRLIDSKTPVNLNYPHSKLIVYGFDVLQCNGVSLIELPCCKRREHLVETHSIVKVSHIQISYPEDEQKLLTQFRKVVDEGYEGVIVKSLLDKYYTNGSRLYWLKMKKGFQFSVGQTIRGYDFDLVVMGGYFGKTENKKVCSYLLGILYKGKIHPITKVGSGFTEESHQEVRKILKPCQAQIKQDLVEYQMPDLICPDVWYTPNVVFEVVCQQLTRSPLYTFGFRENYGGLSLRFPIFKGLRVDKNVKDITKGEDILELAKTI